MHTEAADRQFTQEWLREFLTSKSTFKVKCTLFLLFAITLCAGFTKILHSDCYSTTVEAINDGYPFHRVNYESGYLEYIPYYKVLGDHGFGFLLSGISKGFSLVPGLNKYEFSGHEVPIISFFVLLILDICLLSLPLPNILLFFSQIAFILSIYFIDGSLFSGYSGYRAIDGIAPLLISLTVALLILDSPQETRKRPYIVLGLMAGFLSLFRQTIPFIFQFSLIGILLSSSIFLTKNWKESPAWQIVRKVGWTFLSFIFVNCMISLLCTVIYKCPFTFTPPIKHGSGQPLYCSLGYVDNPYNIAWEDDNSTVNHILVYDSAELPPHTWAENLGKIYWQVVKEDPLLFFRNIVAKALKLNEYLLTSKVLPDNTMDICSVSPRKTHLVLYLITIFYIFFLAFTVFIRKANSSQVTFLFLATLVLSITSAAAPILIFPGFYASFLGFLISSACVLLPLFYVLISKKESLILASGVRKRILYSALSLTLLACSFVFIQNQKNRIRASALLADEAPIEKIKSMGYRYGYLFNRLNREEQEQILSKLDCNFNSSSQLFSPKFLSIQEVEGRGYCEAHLIVFLSSAWSAPIPRADQGPVGSYILLSKGNRNFENASFNYFPKSCVFNRLTDAAWNGKYTFLTLPVSKEFLESAETTCISAWEMLPDQNAIGAIAHRKIEKHP